MKSLFVVALSALALSGCSLSQERPDLAALIRALQGDATYKETCLLINRTSHDLLVGQNAYLVKDCGSGSTQSRTVREGESLGDVIAELNGQAQNRSGVFFLVRGIGKKTEKILYGQATRPAASGLRPIAGDLLVIDPPPPHLLFKEYEGKEKARAKEIIIRVLRREGTHKEQLLYRKGTFPDHLVGHNAYLVEDCGSGTTQTRTVREGELVEEVIAEVNKQAQNRSGVFFLVGGTGKTEEIFYGQATQPAASGLRPIVGDLLVIDPPPTDPLFKEYEVKKKRGAKGIIQRVLKGEGTHKEQLLYRNGTFPGRLVGQNAYPITFSPGSAGEPS